MTSTRYTEPWLNRDCKQSVVKKNSVKKKQCTVFTSESNWKRIGKNARMQPKQPAKHAAKLTILMSETIDR